jgi:hypothetical protein
MSDGTAKEITAERLLSQLSAEGLLDERGEAEFRRLALERRNLKEPPLFLRITLALGAFLSTVFLVTFLFAAQLISDRNGAGMAAWGVVFMAAAAGLYRLKPGGDGVGQAWLLQLSVSAMLTGKALFLMGAMIVLAPHYDPRIGWMLTGVAAAVTVVVYPAFPASVDRFLSAFVTLMLALFAIVNDEMRGRIPAAILPGWFIAQLIAAAAIFACGWGERVLRPAAYALIVSLCAITAFWGFHSEIFYWTGSGAWTSHYGPRTLEGTLALALALMALIVWAAGGVKELRSEPVALACAGTALLASQSAPGVLLSIGLMILGHARRDHLLLVGGAVLLPTFITLYYYNLNLDFVTKSGVLIGSGAVLLGGRAYMRLRGWDSKA